MASVHAIRARISEFNAKFIPALEIALDTLQRERDILQNQLDTYRFPVATLPNEITSEIFLDFVPPYPKRPPSLGPLSPSTLCHVCHRWREIALATPSLWRGIELHLNGAEQFHKSQLRWLETQLSLSKQCPLSIELVYNAPEGPFDVHSSLKPFVDAIVGHCARWEEVMLRIPPRDAKLLVGNMPLLRTLHFGVSDVLPEDPPGVATSPPDTIFSGAANLKTLFIDNYFSPSSFTLPWSQLTTIIAFDPLYDNQCADILRHAVNVDTCRLTIAKEPAALIDLVIPPLVHLRLLSLWDLGATPASFIAALFDTLVLPSLEVLEISADWFTPDPCANIAALISRSGCSLRELDITSRSAAGPPDAAYYRDHFPSVPNISVGAGFWDVDEDPDDD
ncbi:hypothetical protein C8R47DRAFT_1225099 [Mycena vitilis]|nr:hypothetical protein C8R47DRAFT_1225099 [Mycena vitilis]